MPKIFTSRGVIEIQIPSKRASPKGEIYILCPLCASSRKPEHQKEEKLAINVISRKWRCNICGEGGLLHDEVSISNMKIKPLMKPLNELNISDDMVRWFWEERKISVTTLRHFKVSMSKESIRQIRLSDANHDHAGEFLVRKCTNFKYFQDSILINVKFRDRDKNFKLMAPELTMFNIDSIKGKTYAIITEGEIDCMSYHEADLTSVTSVPNGATISVEEREHFEKTGKLIVKSQLNLEYLDKCIEDFEDKEIVYIATDDDPAGLKLREELARRIGKEKCKFISFSKWKKPDGSSCNDPNDVLVYHDKEELARTLNYAETYPIEGVSTAMKYWGELEVEYERGRERAISTGYKSLDPHWGWVGGWSYAINGFPSSGKSQFMFNNMIITSALYNFKWGAYLPENYPPRNVVNILTEIFVGNTMDPRFEGRMDKQTYRNAIENFIDTHVYFVDNEKGYTPEKLRSIKRSMIRQYGIVAFLTDPWSNLIHNYGTMREDQYLEKELTEEVRLSTRTGLINVICVHPPTPPKEKDKVYSAPSMFDITGGKMWAAKVYSIVCIHQQDSNDYTNTITEIHVQRNKEEKIAGLKTSRNNPVLLSLERKSGRFLEKESDDEFAEYNYFPVTNIPIITKQKEDNINGF